MPHTHIFILAIYYCTYLEVAEGQARPGTFTTSGAVGTSTANVREHTRLQMFFRRKLDPKRNIAGLKYMQLYPGTRREAKKFRVLKIAEDVHIFFGESKPR